MNNLNLDSSSRFEIAIKNVLEAEGGYVNDPSDSGGETKFGISKRSYPDIDIKNLTIDHAKEIYKKDFWDNKACDKIESLELSVKVFDSSVNIGEKPTVILLQRALRACNVNVIEDGIYGPVTNKSIELLKTECFLTAFKSERAGYYRELCAKWPKNLRFLKGWLNRAYS